MRDSGWRPRGWKGRALSTGVADVLSRGTFELRRILHQAGVHPKVV